MAIAQEIEVYIRIRVSDEQLQAAGLTVQQFAQNMFLFEHGFDIPSVVLSQRERESDPVERWDAAIVKASVVTPSARPGCIEGNMDLALKRIVEREGRLSQALSAFSQEKDPDRLDWTIAE